MEDETDFLSWLTLLVVALISSRMVISEGERSEVAESGDCAKCALIFSSLYLVRAVSRTSAMSEATS